jgi:hypothetical protein
MSEELKKVQCAHCGKWIELTPKELRALNYCWECK